MPRAAQNTRPSGRDGAISDVDAGHFAPSLLYAAAKLYYTEDATQAEVAAQLGTSRATVSRLLAEAKRQGIVRIEVVPPEEAASATSPTGLARALGLTTVSSAFRSPTPGAGRGSRRRDGRHARTGRWPGTGRRPACCQATCCWCRPAARSTRSRKYELTPLPGVLVAPTVGGNDQPEEWYQTNEITRLVANRIGGRPNYLFAPALPGPDLYPSLLNDPSIQRVLHLWPRARCALMGVGAPPLMRSDIPRFVPTASTFAARRGRRRLLAVLRPGRRAGRLRGTRAADRVELEALRHIPVTIAVAVGKDKIDSIIGGALGGLLQPTRHRSRDRATPILRKPESAR